MNYFRKLQRVIKSHIAMHIAMRSLLKVVLGLFACIVFLIVFSFLLVTFVTRNNPIPNKQAREKSNTEKLIVADVTELYPVTVKGIVVPHTVEDIVKAVKENDHVSIGGGRNSMGGQTASEKAIQIDMREFNKILSFSTTTKEITVEAGIRWRDIQDYIDPYNLSVKIMQTYSNFTVGGSLSVNVHGRYIGLGPIILSVKGFTIVLADGSVVHATPTSHTDIYYSAIGGMGGIGVITDVTLSLADNVNLERSPSLMKTSEYYDFFKANVRDNKNVVFHNGDMYPPNFEYVRAVSWVTTDKQPTTVNRLIPQKQDYWKERIAWVIMSEWPKGRWIREYVIDPILYLGDQPVHTRNYEASYDVAELEPESREKSSYVLEEYFVPVEHFNEWVPMMKKVFNKNHVNVINVSIRHALPDPGAKLAWARTESFAFVVYYKQGSSKKDRDAVASWTREMTDAVLAVGGTYYLPYQPHATRSQFINAYPHAVDFFEIKKAYDPADKFTNKLWDTYYSDEDVKFYKEQISVQKVSSSTVGYVRAYDNTYLSIPEWFIVYNSGEYARVLTYGSPSKFSYFGAIREYWKEYKTVKKLTKASSHDNSDYISVLRVIGVSYSLELAIKGTYENTIGRLTEWLSGNRSLYEEKIAAQMNQDYSAFIYDYPWYDFPYGSYLALLWKSSDDTNLTSGQYIRKVERLLFVSLEIEVKVVYSKVIAYVTHQKFGVQDDVVYAVISHDGGATSQLLYAPHYQPFTRDLLTQMKYALQMGSDFKVLDISGNQKIVLSFVTDVESSSLKEVIELFRTKEMFYDQVGLPKGKVRLHVDVAVQDLFSVYTKLQHSGVTIDHLYDY